MQTVVQIGAGSIGRGFLGQLWTEAGYEVVFVDVDEPLVATLDQSRSYPLRLVTNDGDQTMDIAPVRAVSAHDTRQVAKEIAHCAFAATAVGARRMAAVGRDLIAPALAARAEHGMPPLNILLCENGTTVQQHLRDGVYEALGDVARSLASPNVFAAVRTVVERTVPEVHPTPDEDPLLVRAEPYRHLPVNASEWLGPTTTLEKIDGVDPVTGDPNNDRFAAFQRRKLFLHNGGHALLAYHGHQRGYTDFDTCANDPELVAELQGFWREVSAALARPLPSEPTVFNEPGLSAFTDDLLARFRNRLLGDTVARVARDPARKLGHDERLVGAALYCEAHGVDPEYTTRAIVAALRYDAPDDVGAHIVQSAIRNHGAAEALHEISGVPIGSPILDRVKRLSV